MSKEVKRYVARDIREHTSTDAWSAPNVMQMVDARDYDALLAERDVLKKDAERLARDAKNDAIAYKAVIERQEELRAELDAIRAQPEHSGLVTEAMRNAAIAEYDRHDGDFSDFADSVIRAALSAKPSTTEREKLKISSK